MQNLGIANKLILAFVSLIIGVILIGTVATNSLTVTEKTLLENEAIDISSARDDNGDINESVTFTVANAPTTWKINDCPLSSVTYGNSSLDYTLTTDYLITLSTGVLSLKNVTEVIEGSNNTLIDYTYCADDYMNLSWGRTMLNLIAGFFAIAILLVSLGLFYSVAKDAGIV
ncbi:MAG: hypothetical protein ACOC56_02540 [Atribacterota bacterium]